MSDEPVNRRCLNLLPTAPSAAEVSVVDLLGKAWDEFLLLEVLHNDEIPDFRKAIHDAQRIVMARVVQRRFNAEIQADQHADQV